MNALSIKQPWAWLIVNGYKKIENRDWRTHYRGHVLIHASKGLSKKEYNGALEFLDVENIDVEVPPYEELQRGGIVGKCSIVDCVDQSEDPFFVGKYGFVIEAAKPLTFIECKGSLGFWKFEGELF